MLLFFANDTFNVVIPLVAGIATLVFLCLIMAVVFWLVRRKDRRDGLVWAALAQQLGFQLGAPTDRMASDVDRLRGRTAADLAAEGPMVGQPMFGHLAGHAVQARIGRERQRRSHSSRYARIRTPRYFTICQASWDGPAGLEFRFANRRLGTWIADLLGVSDSVAIGDPGFDQQFVLRTNDPQRAMRLLRTPTSSGDSCAAAFVSAAAQGWNLAATENEVLLRYEGKVLQADQLAAGLKFVAGLAEKLGQVTRTGGI